jgi:thioesterase domain-containing protein
MAVRLRANGEEVALLALLDAYPVIPDPAATPLAGDNPETLAELLVSLGGRVDGPVTRDDLDRLAAREDGPLHGFPAAAVTVLPDVFAGNGNALLRHWTGQFDGDLLLFTAADDLSPGDPAAWHEHITRSVHVQPISCRHGDMLQPAPLSVIGPILAEHLQPAEEASCSQPVLARL